MKEIPLTQDQVTLVDDEDYNNLMQYKWCFYRGKKSYHTGYAGNSILGDIHRFLLEPNRGQYIDHKDGNGLNNQRDNLRICTRSQNMMNQKKTRGTSKYKGVYYVKSRNKWTSAIKHNRKSIFLGQFREEKDAALAYNLRAKEIFGEFARLNEIC